MAGFTSKETFALPPIVDKRTCEWCSSPVWIRDQFPSITTSPWQQWPSDLLLDLQYCQDCINEYHQVRDDFVAENPDKKKELWSGDVERISLWIKVALESIQGTSCSTLEVLNNLENHNSAFVNTKNNNPVHNLHVPVQEVLQFPLLLFDKVLADLFESAMTFLIDQGSPPVLSQRLSGLYVLLVHPSQKLRKWAERTIKGFNKLTKEDYDDMKKEVQWIVEVATLNMFDLGFILEEPMDIFSASYLPFHLFDLPFNYWRGFLRLLLSMSEQAIRHRLLGVSGHRDLPDTIINVIEAAYGKDKSIFWPAFNCLVIILESCGPHLWPVLSREPPEVFGIITNHAVYSKALLQYILHSEQAINLSSSTDMGESQEFGLGSQGVPTGSLPKTALNWFQTFVMSVLDFGDVTCQCVSAVIRFLSKYSGNMDVKIKILTIVSTVMRSKQLALTKSTINLWVPHVVELASLTETSAETLRSVVHPARELIFTLMIKSENQPGTSPIKSVNFNELTSQARKKNLIETLVSLLEKTNERETLKTRPSGKRNCARKSMGPSLRIFKQTQTGYKSKVHVVETKKEQDESHESERDQRANITAKIELEKFTNFEVKRKTQARRAHISAKDLMFPKVLLVDFVKNCSETKTKYPSSTSTQVSTQKDTGSKEKPILVDSDNEQEDRKPKIVSPQNTVQDFSTFSRRSTEISRSRLEKIHSPKGSPKRPISPSNMISKLSKSRRSSDDDDDDTSSLESNSDNHICRSKKRRKRRLQVFEDSSDETESLDEEPLSTWLISNLPKRSSTAGMSRNGNKSSRLGKRTGTLSLSRRHPVSSNYNRLTSTDSSTKENFPPAISHFKALSVLNRKVKSEHFPSMSSSSSSSLLATDNLRTEIITTESKSHQGKGGDDILLKPKIEDYNWFENKYPSTSNTSSNNTETQDVNAPSVHVKQEKHLEVVNESNSDYATTSIQKSQADDVITFEEELNEISEALSRDLESDAGEAQWMEESALQSENTTVQKQIPGSPERSVPEVKQEVADCNEEHYLPLEEIGRDYFGDTEDGDDDNGCEDYSSPTEERTMNYTLCKILDEMERKYGDLSDSDDEHEFLKNLETDVHIEDNEVQLEDKDGDIEDNEVQLEDKDSDIEDNEVQLEDKDSDIEDNEVQLEDKDSDIEDNEVQLEDKDSDIEDNEVQLEDNGSHNEDNEVQLEDEDVGRSTGQPIDQSAQNMKQELNVRENNFDFVDNDDSRDSIDWVELDRVEEAMETKSSDVPSPLLEATPWCHESTSSATPWCHESTSNATHWCNENTSNATPWCNESTSNATPWCHESTSNAWVKEEPLNFNDSQESAREGVETDIKSDSESDTDYDIIEIFCSQRSESFSTTTPVKVKVEKSDDIPDVPSEQVQEESSVTEPSVPQTRNQEQPASSPAAVVTTTAVAVSKSPFNLKPAEIIPSLKFNTDHLISFILSWKCDWLDAQDRALVPIYKVLQDAEKLPKTFDSIDMYYKSFARLLYVEAWEQILKDWRDHRCKKEIISSVINSVSKNHQFTVIEATSYNVRNQTVNNRLFPEESELVIVKVDGHVMFGLIDTVEQEIIYRRRSSSSDDGEPPERLFNLTFTIRMKTCIRLSTETSIKVHVVTSLLTTLRQWSALVNFQRSLLLKDILRPRALTYFCADEKPIEVEANEHYNQSQVRVIETATHAINKAFTLPRICLVQGPPGTGKSHTIVGMVARILNDIESTTSCQPQSTSQLLPEKPRILICCPSNEGIDELIHKLLHASIRKTNHGNVGSDKRNSRGGGRYKNCGDFSLVRVGRKSKIRVSVKHVTLENLTRQALVDAGHGTGQENTTAIKKQIREIEKQIDALEKENFLLKKGETESEKFENLKEDKSKLITKKQTLDREYRRQRDQTKQRKRMESRIKKEILNNADIVCSTLSGSGSTTLQSEMRGTDGKKIPFSCVIVDEACQCCELDILIPLQFMSSKLILVGDPEQLPATVFSKDARRLLYDRSMFSRLYKFFRELPRNERPVHLLNVQYRMHPEIAHFPSKHVYNDSIHNDSSLVKRVFPIKTPYALFNVHSREFNDRRGAIYNMKEVDLVTSLCEYLVPRYVQASDIGIITPYRAQLTEIQRKLRHRGEFSKDIEVKTVDGFQGREKNIIIMSCVRSERDIGFLQYLNRLNVAITRARHTLFIFGNLDSLEKAGPVWNKLINDAHHRKVIYEVNRIDDVKRAICMASSSYHSHGPRVDDSVQASMDRRHTMTHKENRPPPKAHPKDNVPSSIRSSKEIGPSFKVPHKENGSSSKTSAKENRSSSNLSPTDNRSSSKVASIDNGPSSMVAPTENGPSSTSIRSSKENGPSFKIPHKENGSSSKTSAKENRSSFNLAPTKNGPSSKVAPTENGPSSKVAPTENGPSSMVAPTENGPFSKATPTQNGPSSKIAPTENGPSSKVASTDNGPFSKTIPTENGPSSNVAPTDNGPFSKATPTEGGHSQVPSKENGPSDKTPPKEKESQTLPDTKASDVSSMNSNEADYSANNEAGFMTDERQNKITTNSRLYRLQQLLRQRAQVSRHGSDSVVTNVTTDAIIPRKRKSTGDRPHSPKKVRFGKAFVLEFGKRSGRRSYSYNIQEDEDLTSSTNTSDTMGCNGTPSLDMATPGPYSTHDTFPETSTVASTIHGNTTAKAPGINNTSSSTVTITTTHQPPREKFAATSTTVTSTPLVNAITPANTTDTDCPPNSTAYTRTDTEYRSTYSSSTSTNTTPNGDYSRSTFNCVNIDGTMPQVPQQRSSTRQSRTSSNGSPTLYSNTTSTNTTPNGDYSRSTINYDNIETRLDGTMPQVPQQRSSTRQSRTSTNESPTPTSKLDEVATRVRERTPRQRVPVEISSANFRRGRAGRVHQVSEDQRSARLPVETDNSATTRPPGELRDWHPHGGPRRRTAQHSPSSVQDLRSRGVSNTYSTRENARLPQKRQASLLKNMDHLQKKSRKK